MTLSIKKNAFFLNTIVVIPSNLSDFSLSLENTIIDLIATTFVEVVFYPMGDQLNSAHNGQQSAHILFAVMWHVEQYPVTNA